MTIRTRYILATGEIEYSVSGPDGLVGFSEESGSAWLDGQGRSDEHYVSTADDIPAIVPRPVIGLPATHTLQVNTEWIVLDVPEGTRVTIDGEDMGAVDADGLALMFAASGVWRVDLAPPFPWRSASCEVTVA